MELFIALSVKLVAININFICFFKVSTSPRVSLIEHVKSLLLNVLRKIQSHCLSEDDVDWMYFQVDRAYHLMVRGSSLYSIPDTLLARIQEVRQVVGELNKDTFWLCFW